MCMCNCVYQKGRDPQHHVSDVIRVGKIAWCHHLTDPNRKVQTAKDPGKDLHTQRSGSLNINSLWRNTLTDALVKLHNSANDSLWEYKGSSSHSQCYRWRVERTGSLNAAGQHQTNNHCMFREHSQKWRLSFQEINIATWKKTEDVRNERTCAEPGRFWAKRLEDSNGKSYLHTECKLPIL